MTLKARDVTVAGIVCFVAWGHAVDWWPTLRWVGMAWATGVLAAVLVYLYLVLFTSRGSAYRQRHRTSRPRAVSFIAPTAWKRETSSLRVRQIYTPVPLYPGSRKISHALDDLLGLVVRDFVTAWYSHISKQPVFSNEVDKAIRQALANIRDRLFDVDLTELITSRIVPILTAHFRDFNDAERAVRGRKLNRNVTESEELELAIAAKYKDGKLHPAASLSYSDTRTVQQEHLREMTAAILPQVLPASLLNSRAVSTLIRELVGCAVMMPVMNLLSEADTWNQLMENYGRGMLQDRSTVRRLRAALDAHASPVARASKTTTFPRLTPEDGERRFEKFIRAIRKVNNLSDARRFRNEVASQLKRDSEQEGQDQIYMRRLDMGKRLLDQRVQQLAAGVNRGHPPVRTNPPPSLGASRLGSAPLVELLRDSSALSYFMEFMDRQNMMCLVQFWLVVDGFRNPLEDDGLDEDHMRPTLAPWTEADCTDLAQLDQAYLGKPELTVPDSSREAIRDFLTAGKRATPEQYVAARRAVLRAQSTVLGRMNTKYFPAFKKSDLWYKCLASEEASKSTAQHTARARPSSPALSNASQSYSLKATPAASLNPKSSAYQSRARRGLSTTDLRAMATNGSVSPDARGGLRRSLDGTSPSPLLDDDDYENDHMSESLQSLDQGLTGSVPDTRVVKAVEEALSNIMDNQRPGSTAELGESLFGDDDSYIGIFSVEDGAGKGSTEEPRPAQAAGKEAEKPSLASLGLVSAASRIGVFEDNDLFGDEDKFLSDEQDDLADGKDSPVEDEVHEAAPGDLGLAEAITDLTNAIDRLAAQEAIIDSLTKKAELTNNTAELRILRKSKASLQREVRRKELQRQQYVIQESDNSLYGRSSITIKSIQVGRDEDGKEFAVYVIEVQRIAGEKMPAATWVVTRRYSEFHELHQKLRNRYPSVRNLDFPRRRMVMKLQSEFLRKRQQALQQYMRQLLRLPEVCRSRDLRAFLSQSLITPGEDLVHREDKKDMMTRFYDSVTDGMEDILGNIPVLDQLSVAGQSLIAAATNQLSAMPLGINDDYLNAAEAEAELNAFENKEMEPFIKPICDIFLELFELNRGNNWLRGRAVVVVLHQLLGGTIERKLRDNLKVLVQEDAILRYIRLVRDSMWPNGCLDKTKLPRTQSQKTKTRREASLMLATLVPDLAGSVVGRLNAQAASRRIFATLNNSRLNAHLAFTILDEVVHVVFKHA